ncbi:MAG: PadR family transcriptional regulator [Actinomycetota bacterium]
MVSRVAAMVLGLLAQGERHGYDLVREMGERGMLRWARASKVGVYKALARLQEEGCLTSWTEREGNLPEKRVYAITAAGQERLRDLVYSICSSREPIRMSTAVGVFFLDCLDKKEAADALRQRREFLAAQARQLARERELLDGIADETFLDILAREQSAYGEESRWIGGIVARIEGEGERRRGSGLDRKGRSSGKKG